MPIQIDIPDDDIEHLNAPAQSQVKQQVETYVDLLLAESSRIEAAQRTTSGDPEINSSMVKDAAHLISRGYQKHRRPAWLTACQVVASLTALFTGLLFDFDRLKDPLMLVVFVLLLAAAITFNVIVLMKE